VIPLRITNAEGSRLLFRQTNSRTTTPTRETPRVITKYTNYDRFVGHDAHYFPKSIPIADDVHQQQQQQPRSALSRPVAYYNIIYVCTSTYEKTKKKYTNNNIKRTVSGLIIRFRLSLYVRALAEQHDNNNIIIITMVGNNSVAARTQSHTDKTRYAPTCPPPPVCSMRL